LPVADKVDALVSGVPTLREAAFGPRRLGVAALAVLGLWSGMFRTSPADGPADADGVEFKKSG